MRFVFSVVGWEGERYNGHRWAFQGFVYSNANLCRTRFLSTSVVNRPVICCERRPIAIGKKQRRFYEIAGITYVSIPHDTQFLQHAQTIFVHTHKRVTCSSCLPPSHNCWQHRPNVHTICSYAHTIPNKYINIDSMCYAYTSLLMYINI